MALITGAVGCVIFYLSSCPLPHFTKLYFYFYFFLVTISICTSVAFFLNNAAPKPPEMIFKKVFGVIFRNLDVIVFFIVIFVVGMLTGS